jgi:thiol-disulfide isomerase/thioredoxin
MKVFLKFSFLIVAICLIVSPSNAQNNPGQFSLKGKFKGEEGDILYLNYSGKDSKLVKDSSVVMNGSYIFKGELHETTFSYLYAKSKGSGKRLEIFLEPTEMLADITAEDIPGTIVIGSFAQRERMQLNTTIESVRKEMIPLLARYDAANIAYREAKKKKLNENELDSLMYKANAIHDEFDPYQDRIAELNYRFFRAHPSSVVTAYQLRFYVNRLQVDSLKVYYKRMDNQIQQTSYGKLILDELNKLSSGSPGSSAKNFSTTDIIGKQVSLSDFKGKYVLLDFWASWCAPCRKGNPHLKELYSQYKNKGFEVIGVSDDDRDQAAWKNAVKKDGLLWTHVLRGLKYDDAKGYDKSTDISDLFGIHTLPTQILINPDGKIIARYGGGGEDHAELDAKLKSVFK